MDLLQLIRATKAFFGVCKICLSGRYRRPRRTQNPSIRLTPATFGVRKNLGAGLLANAVSQVTDALRQDRLRGQARSYR
jgi:hypothetical protein